jgi:hypothetical protein
MPVNISVPRVLAAAIEPRRKAGQETPQLENRDVSMNNTAGLARA